MATVDDNLMDWLRDAHAMEEQAERMFSTTASRIDNYPEMKTRLEGHAQASRRQADMLRVCIERRGGDPSALKDLAAKATAMAQGLSGIFVSDEIVKAAMATYTFEHMEIASYRSLIAAADAVGDQETRRVCESHLAQEEEMADWLEQQLPLVTQQFLQRSARPNTTAKH
ncbi:DUF892 family protein [Schlegelella sp. S2-27]|uniref:DUF892 family protein n=1 Tax=Caldimonas mangrovi TaxID=2944811 RepID=A0ABT0YLK6_9BURK|nr:ferritin-like domain-containing protein [Caldimonas mangrovi]MCM5679613.1 DUF892 family protein [Caldimonas mangrovi]